MNNSFQDGQFVPVESLLRSTQPRRLWRSPEEFTDPESARQQSENQDFEDGVVTFGESDRRRFLSLMAGSLALAGLTGCTRQPTEQILPYVTPPENAIPGRPKFYATAVPVSGVAEGVLVESHLGRPTKVEGNPEHPASLGATGVLSQACLMDLYDADRAKQIKHLGVPQTWDEFQIAFARLLGPIRTRQGAGLHILTETVTSPSLGAHIQAVLKSLPSAQWQQFEPAGSHAARSGAMLAFGRLVNTYYRFEEADVVLALDSDFLTSGRGSTRYARGFADRRRRGGRTDMNRLYAVECEMTSTGGKADHRLALRYRQIETFARDLAAAVGVKGVEPSGTSTNSAWVNAVAKDLQAHSGASIVIAGEQQTPAVHVLAHAINATLRNIGKTTFHTEPIELQPVDQITSLKALASHLQAGQVELLLIFGGNPVYNAPTDLAFASALSKAKHSVRIGLHEDETSSLCHWNIPESHFLEDWGDARAIDGTVTIQQPLIAPLYDSRTPLHLLDVILQAPGRPSYDIIRSHWQQSQKGDFEAFWRKSVHDGMVAGSALPAITPPLQQNWPRSSPAPAGASLELVFRPDVYLYDGRYANNVWLQELPHPMTKLTWDNAVHVSPRTAQQLKLKNQERVELRLRGQAVRGSVWISPGHPDNSVLIHLGYGRSKSGRAGDGAGFSAYKLRTSDSLWSADGVEISKVNESYPLASTQMHQFMEGRDVALSLNLDRYRQEPDYLRHKLYEPAPGETLYPRWLYGGYAWGLSIDQTACVNCNACVIACQAENNIPVVGKGQVLARRAMHWIRIDTYYEGNLDRPSAHYQPIPCMQCENAPCELVCPVQATNHSSDGLNDMVYNRCVGTRYCSNNCPYKVRRFNFLLYADWRTESWKLQRNPDVTVRSRGVMEKCTYCVQRIREAEIDARVHDGYIKDGAIQTACQQVCPTQAIVFGDINNKDNRVAKLKAEKLNYALLADLNTRPRTTYLAELRNPNPELKETNG
jgi:Fe-S-cluster-containing dehydrogenase component/anaerobic selenocysteine-containing dehydrogenase